jgi:hypothetical protein
MLRVCKAAGPLVGALSVAFTRRTFQRVVVLIVGAVLSPRRRTVTAILRAAGPLAAGHWSDYHRVLCRRVWSNWRLGKLLAAMVLELVPAGEPVVVPVDDNTVRRDGPRVWGKGKHLDPLRSTRRWRVWLWGHRWVVLAVNVRFPFASRPWALPVLCALYRTRELNKEQRRRHKKPIRLAMQLVAALVRWFPDRRFILLGDGGFSSHELAKFCRRHRRHVTLVSRLHPGAALYDAPKPYPKGEGGRPRVRGKRRPSPKQVVARTPAKRRRRCKVTWYGGKTRRVELVTGTGRWYKAGGGVAVPVRWVFVHDRDGTHRDEYFYCTDPSLAAPAVVGLYTGRWSIEVTFQEVRAHLGFTTVRNRCVRSVLRTAPCLLGLFSLVCLTFARHARERHARGRRVEPLSTPWYAKPEPTFADAITAVRRLCWAEFFRQPPWEAGANKLPRRLRLVLLDQLSRAA